MFCSGIAGLKPNAMKKIILCISTALLTFTFSPNELKAATDTHRIEISGPGDTASSKVLLDRLNEINAMDRSSMSRSDKKALRKEVRSIDKQLREVYGGIYISVGALIIIILLLIIFF